MEAPPHEPSYTIPEFCKAEGISEPTYYKLRTLGLAPTELRYLSMVKITYAERIAWQKRLMNPTDELAQTLLDIATRKVAQGRKAAAASVASPRHISNRRRGKQADAVVPPKRKHARRGA
jgi:hypothetical protein